MRSARMRFDSHVRSAAKPLDSRHVSGIFPANVDREFGAAVPFAQKPLEVEIFPHSRMRELEKKVKWCAAMLQLSPVTSSNRYENGTRHRRCERVNAIDGEQVTKQHRGKAAS